VCEREREGERIAEHTWRHNQTLTQAPTQDTHTLTRQTHAQTSRTRPKKRMRVQLHERASLCTTKQAN
jgi:hypothetical protein